MLRRSTFVFLLYCTNCYRLTTESYVKIEGFSVAPFAGHQHVSPRSLVFGVLGPPLIITAYPNYSLQMPITT
jgi:hypothetical protein